MKFVCFCFLYNFDKAARRFKTFYFKSCDNEKQTKLYTPHEYSCKQNLKIKTHLRIPSIYVIMYYYLLLFIIIYYVMCGSVVQKKTSIDSVLNVCQEQRYHILKRPQLSANAGKRKQTSPLKKNPTEMCPL